MKNRYYHKYNQFKRFSLQLNRMLENGSFYRLTSEKQNMLLHRLRRLYNQLCRYIPEVSLKHILAAAAALILGISTKTSDAQYFAPKQPNPFGIVSGSGYLMSPSLVDIDGDGDHDLFTGDEYGIIRFYENTGNPYSPGFAAPQDLPFGLDTCEGYIFPDFVDIDNDGDYDLFVGEDNNIKFFENTGIPQSPAFAVPQDLPFGLQSPYEYGFPCFADIDNDGDFDAFIGEYYGHIKYYENTGSPTVPSFGTPQTDPFGLSPPGYYMYWCLPSFCDIDNDGDLDALNGGYYYGNMMYYKNTGTAVSPAFASPEANPFGLESALLIGFPEFVDIDNDGDMDLFIGEYYSVLQYYENITIADDAGIIAIDSPASDCDLTAMENISVQIQNFGLNPQSNFTVSYNVNGGAPISETITNTINPGEVLPYTFNASFNMSGDGYTYIINSWTNINGDTNTFNDSTSGYEAINKPTIANYPYSEDFESGNGGWSSGGSYNSWEQGLPDGDDIYTAASGTNAWITKLNDYYSNNEMSYVDGPCFDLSTLDDPVVKLNIAYSTESGWDGAALYSSVDNGNSWQIVGQAGDTANWYNDSGINGLDWFAGVEDGWCGEQADWVTAVHDLSGLAGQDDVRFRIVFGSDESVFEYDGFAFDDFRIEESMGIDDNEPGLNTNIYPNPLDEKLYISINDVCEINDVTIEMINITGHKVICRDFIVHDNDANLEINTSNLPEGIYIVKIKNRNKINIRKIVIQ